MIKSILTCLILTTSLFAFDKPLPYGHDDLVYIPEFVRKIHYKNCKHILDICKEKESVYFYISELESVEKLWKQASFVRTFYIHKDLMNGKSSLKDLLGLLHVTIDTSEPTRNTGLIKLMARKFVVLDRTSSNQSLDLESINENE